MSGEERASGYDVKEGAACAAPRDSDPGQPKSYLGLAAAIRDGTVELLDEKTFIEHADTMRYPEHVVRTAWNGIAAVTPRFVNHEWPFDGFLDELAHAQLSPDP